MYIVNMNIKDEIFKLLDDSNTTLVFPTENTARYWLSRYVREKGCSILASRALAFDKFKEMFSPSDGCRPADKYHRLAFTSSFLESGRTGMHYLYEDKLKSYHYRFVPFLMGILPSLGETESVVVKNRKLNDDLQILKSAYAGFLESNGLFEPLWEKSSAENLSDPQGRFVLIGYDADIQMQKLMRDLGEVDYISKLTLQCPEKPEYLSFFSAEAELEALFQKLQELKEQGVPTDDIIISTPSMDEIRPYLERRGSEYNIPLTFMKSLRLSETVPGRYLFSIRRCINEGLSFHSMESLLLNSSIPFRDIATNRRLVRFMIDHNQPSGSLDFSDDGLMKDLARDARENSDESLLGLYKGLKSSLSAIRRANDGDELIRDIHGLTTLLLGSGEFSSSDSESKDVYSFIISKLAEISRTLKECSLSVGSLFSIFMGDVENLSYVSQEKKAGIRIYEYGQDYLLDVPYHFLIGLNDSNATVSQTALSFLEDHEVEGRQVLDVTEQLLDYYRTLSPNVWISGSEASHSGSQNAPTCFVRQDAVREMVLSEPIPVFEKADAASLSQAKRTSLSPKGPNLAVDSLGPAKDPDSSRLSYTSISGYAKCPYSEYLKNGMTKDVPDAFEPAKQDDMAIGTFLHKVIQAFMENHIGELLEEPSLEEYHAEIGLILDRMLEENRIFDSYTKASIRGRYFDSLKKVLTILLVPSRKNGYIGPFIPRVNEQKLNRNPAFTGSIDTVIEDNNGQVFLLDYKKGAGNATYQLVLYKRLYEEENPDRTVKDCFFFSMGNGTYHGFDAKSWAEQEQKLDNDIELTRSGYKAGNWIATPSRNSCQRCSERAICRRRFNLQ